ncbi:MAG TPA: FGGY family carbohydrate kinase, partial [Stellaceae bacterium]|nr:FGGY family carbohydrate kinase [Stellaceae bacterium]
MAAFPSRADGAMALILAIDQGTTSTRSMLFDGEGRVVASRQSEIRQYYPHAGWVEHDPEEIWQSVLETARGVLSTARVSAREVAAIGITNQRETTLLWERATGRPVAPAIVWQDRRTASLCADLARAGYTDLVAARTGLLLDPYFSATKIAWLLDAL